MALQDFINNYNGRTDVGDTDANRGQCVGLIEAWTDYLGEPHTWGNADDLLADADRSAFDVIANAPDNCPVPGDVITWGAGWGGSPVGHCAIVVSADVNSFTVFEQNDRIGGGNGACRVWHFPNYSGVQGWMHPHALDPAPAPVAPPPPPAPEPAPAPVVSEPVPVSQPSAAPVNSESTSNSGTSAPSNVPDVQTTTPSPSSSETPNVVTQPVPETPPTKPTPAPTMPAKGDNMQITPKWHQALSAVAVVLTCASWVVGQLNSVSAVTLTGAIAIAMGLIEKL